MSKTKKVQTIDHSHELCMREKSPPWYACECPCEMCREINGPLPERLDRSKVGRAYD